MPVVDFSARRRGHLQRVRTRWIGSSSVAGSLLTSSATATDRHRSPGPRRSPRRRRRHPRGNGPGVLDGFTDLPVGPLTDPRADPDDVALP